MRVTNAQPRDLRTVRTAVSYTSGMAPSARVRLRTLYVSVSADKLNVVQFRQIF